MINVTFSVWCCFPNDKWQRFVKHTAMPITPFVGMSVWCGEPMCDHSPLQVVSIIWNDVSKRIVLELLEPEEPAGSGLDWCEDMTDAILADGWEPVDTAIAQ